MRARSRFLVALGLVTVAGSLVALGWPSAASGEDACPSAEIRIWKREGTLELYCGGELRRSTAATFGANPVGPKEREGDERTPEGTYRITSRVKSDRFHRFLGVSYPNEDDRKRAHANGITRLGFGIGIHSAKKDLAVAARIWTRFASATGLGRVWGPTDGCIGVPNEDAELLFNVVPIGAKVVIAPSRPAKS